MCFSNTLPCVTPIILTFYKPHASYPSKCNFNALWHLWNYDDLWWKWSHTKKTLLRFDLFISYLKSQTEPCLCKTFTTKIANKEICCCFRRAKPCVVSEFYVIINVQIDKGGLSWLRLRVSKYIRNIVRYCSTFGDTLSYQINWFVVPKSTDTPGLYYILKAFSGALTMWLWLRWFISMGRIQNMGCFSVFWYLVQHL